MMHDTSLRATAGSEAISCTDEQRLPVMAADLIDNGGRPGLRKLAGSGLERNLARRTNTVAADYVTTQRPHYLTKTLLKNFPV